MTDQYDISLKRQALQDLTERARGGIVIYLATWLITTLWAGLPEKFPLFFYLNTSIVVALALVRTAQYLVYKRYPNADTNTMYQWLVAAILIGAGHWGVMAAWMVNDIDFIELRYVYLVIMAGFAIGGTATLSISKTIRLFYPLLIFGPNIALGLYSGDSELRLLILLAVFSLIYVLEASRVTSRDYWNAVSNHRLARKRAMALEELNIVDPLTQLKNRSYFDRKYSEEWKRCDRTYSPLSVLMLDLDHFKVVNDTYGHVFGDECLKEVAAIMTRELPRETDTIARYGGEEFVVLLPDTPMQEAQSIADRLVKVISQSQLLFNRQSVSLSCSIGVSSIIPDHNSNRESLLNAADKALYQAKERGRNQYRLAAGV